MNKTLCPFNPASNFRIHLIFCLCLHTSILIKLSAQCTPPVAETCDEASVLCSLNELNGYTCNNPSTVPFPCDKIRKGYNTSWWGFVSHGGPATIKITVGDCTSSRGLAYGIMGDCTCAEEIITRQSPCIVPHSKDSFNVTLTPCKTYFLWVDGCKGDICDFTINTTGGGRPALAPLGFINDIPKGVIEPICVGACNVKFYIDPQPGACSPTYVWTLDGNELGTNSSEVFLDFPDEGDFVLCVTAYIGNPSSGSICDQQGPVCATVKVRPVQDKVDPRIRIYCNEAVIPGGIKWHSQRIYASGIYREQFTDGNCCKFDSVVEFKILPPPVPVELFHISCDSTPYIDGSGRSWYGCKYQYPITFAKSTGLYQCDSTILLTSAFYSFIPVWTFNCKNGQMQISLTDQVSNCYSNSPKNSPFLSIVKNYFWYNQADPNHTTLSTDSNLVFNTLGTYCADVNIEVTSINNQKKKCIKTVCYEIKSDSLFASSDQLGQTQLCYDEIGIYKSDTGGIKQEWSADGNPVVHSIDSLYNKEIQLSWHEPGIKNICIRHYYGLNSSCLICQKVEVIKAAQAGRDLKVLGYQTKMKATKAESGIWKVISGPGKVNFTNKNDNVTRVTVTKLGHYVLEWSAMLKGCRDKDSIAIDFFKLPFIHSEIIQFNEETESEAGRITQRNHITSGNDLLTSNLIHTNGFTTLHLNESILFEKMEYSWLNLAGKIMLHGVIHSENCTSACPIPAPVLSGMYFLYIKTENQKWVKKIIVME